MVTEMMEKYFTRIVDTEFTAFMEEKLDEVEEGKLDWRQILREFYPDFVSTLSVAEKEIEKWKSRTMSAMYPAINAER